LKEYSHLYIGILNDYDLISSKLMRGTKVDFEDCLGLAQAHKEEINIEDLEKTETKSENRKSIWTRIRNLCRMIWNLIRSV